MNSLAELHSEFGEIFQSLFGLTFLLGPSDQEVALSAKPETSGLFAFCDLVTEGFSEILFVVDQLIVGQNCLPQPRPGVLNDLEVGGAQEELGLELVVAFVVDTEVFDFVLWNSFAKCALDKTG